MPFSVLEAFVVEAGGACHQQALPEKIIISRRESTQVAPNNSFKPKPLRSTKHMAEKACHVFGSTTHFGLTQALYGDSNDCVFSSEAID